MRNYLLLGLIFSIFVAPAFAVEVAQKYIPDAKEVGKARLTYMMWDVYDASLYAPKGQWRNDKPYALQLRYLRSLKGDAIAKRSVEEMRKQGFNDEMKLAAWYSQMRDIFPDVKKGTEIVGISTANKATQFYKNGSLIGEIQDADFGKKFFGIWLNEKTSEPKMRRQLLGLN